MLIKLSYNRNNSDVNNFPLGLRDRGVRGREGERQRGREVVILPLFNKIHVYNGYEYININLWMAY